jgi:hypothetical protein
MKIWLKRVVNNHDRLLKNKILMFPLSSIGPRRNSLGDFSTRDPIKECSVNKPHFRIFQLRITRRAVELHWLISREVVPHWLEVLRVAVLPFKATFNIIWEVLIMIWWLNCSNQLWILFIKRVQILQTVPQAVERDFLNPNSKSLKYKVSIIFLMKTENKLRYKTNLVKVI